MRTAFLAFLLTLLPVLGDLPLNLQLPTENDYIFRDQPEKFYMYVDRNFGGKKSQPWQAGSYGYVRTLVESEEGVLATRFHEGLDIKPIKRDGNGVPLDLVNSIAPGTVAYVQDNAGGSNYGKYVVVEHDWGSGPFFSLYAHLSRITVAVGDKVLGGAALGQLGYTGAGISKTRAHVHLELCMMLSDDFNSWHEREMGGYNPHGLHNGMNLSGIDLGQLYLDLKKNPGISLPSFIRAQEVYFKVTVPRIATPFLVEAYPWLADADPRKPSASWEFAFTASGLPVGVNPSNRSVEKPTVTYVKPSVANHRLKTRGYLTGSGERATLRKNGLRYLRLLVPSAFPELREKKNTASE